MSSQPDGTISYDDFIMKMDANIRHRRALLEENVNEALFLKLHDCMLYTNESIYDSLKRSDFDDTDSILKEDFIRVMKRIGMSNIEPHLEYMLQIGGARIDDERIDIPTFAERLTTEVNKRVNQKKMIKEKFLRKLHSLLAAKGLSPFDFFMRLDVNGSSTVSKTEMKTGMQALGIAITREEFESFWRAIYKARMKIQADAGSKRDSVN